MPRRSGLRRLHLIASMTGFLTILTFWTSTVAVELFGTTDAVRAVKQSILWGLLVLVPALAITGATGIRQAGRSAHPRIIAKKRRMPVIAGIGLGVLVPASFYLAAAASRTDFGPAFYTVQAVELLAGATNLTLMTMSLRDGLRLTGRVKVPS